MLNYIKENFFKDLTRLVLWLPIFSVIGIFLFFSLKIYTIYFLVILLFLILFVIIFYKNKVLKMVVLPFIFILIGYNRSYYFYHKFNSPTIEYNLGYVKIFGTIEDIAVKNNAKDNLYREILVKVEKIEPVEKSFEEFVKDYETENFKIPKKLLIRLDNFEEHVEKGLVSVEAIIYPISKKYHPQSFDFEMFYYFKKIGGIGYKGKIIQNTIIKSKNNLFDIIKKYRIDYGNRVIEHFSNVNGGIIQTLMTGNVKMANREAIQLMNYSGLAHLLSISGVHMMTLIGITSFCIKWLLLRSTKIALNYNVFKISAIISLIINFFYLAFSGFSIAAIRAYIMSVILLFAVIVERFECSLRSVMLVCFIMAMYNPYWIFNPGFQMSFSAVVFLMAGYEYYIEKLENENSFISKIHKNKIMRYVFLTFFTSIIAEMATTPFSIYHFNNYTFYNVFANFIAVPLITFCILPLSMLSLPFYFMNLEKFILIPADFCIDIILYICNFINNIPHSIVFLQSPNYISMFFMVFGGIWFCLWKSDWRKYGIIIYFIGILCIFMQKKPDIIIDYNSNLFLLTDMNYNIYTNSKNVFQIENIIKKLGQGAYSPLNILYSEKCLKNKCVKVEKINNKYIYYKNNNSIEIKYIGRKVNFVKNKGVKKIVSFNGVDYIYLE